jgi:hypothetical protein
MRTHAFVALLLLSSAATNLALAPPAHAAPGEDRALALDLFEQGRALSKKGDYAAALAKFEAAAQGMRTFGILLNIAECQEKLGRTASAWATWREARALAAQAPRADDEAMAAEHQKGLESNLSRLTISVPPSADVPGLAIVRDGEVVPRAAWGTAVAVDPGTHAIEARAPGRRPEKVDVLVHQQGDRATVTIAALDPETAPPAAPAPITAPPHAMSATNESAAQPGADTGSGRRIAGWTLGAVGLAAAGAGVVVALVGQGKHNDAVATDLAGNRPLAEDMESSANTTKTAGYVTLGVGGALFATGVILLLTGHTQPAQSRSTVALGPWASPSAGGATFSGAW